MTHGLAVEAGIDVIDLFLRTAKKDSANLRVRLLNDGDLTFGLKKLEWKWSGHHPWHAVRQTHHDALGDRLSLSAGFAEGLHLRLPLRQVRRLKGRLGRRGNR